MQSHVECYCRPQTKFAKVMFLHLSVILFTGGGGVWLSACWNTHPPGSRHLPRADIPWEQTPLEQTPLPGAGTPLLGADTPVKTPPLRSACWEIRATSGRYASYWNAFLLCEVNIHVLTLPHLACLFLHTLHSNKYFPSSNRTFTILY